MCPVARPVAWQIPQKHPRSSVLLAMTVSHIEILHSPHRPASRPAILTIQGGLSWRL